MSPVLVLMSATPTTRNRFNTQTNNYEYIANNIDYKHTNRDIYNRRESVRQGPSTTRPLRVELRSGTRIFESFRSSAQKFRVCNMKI